MTGAFALKLGISHQRPEQLTGSHLAYLRQMGVECLEVRTGSDHSSLDEIREIKQTIQDAGLHLHQIMLAGTYNSDRFALGLPGCDDDILSFQRFIRDLGKAGVGYTSYCWQSGGTYATGATETRGCPTRLFESFEAVRRPNAYDRTYSDEEVWDNYASFIKQVLPVAEDAGVRLQLHPNDPPVNHQGVARIFRSTDAFRRAMEIAGHSPFSGIKFCVGTWAEMLGPDGQGEDVEAAIREFGSLGRIYEVHFRNVSSTLPDFHETFPDNGYLNMYRIARALAEVGYHGMIVPDHVPQCTESDAGPNAGEAYTFGYIRALIQAVETELGNRRPFPSQD